MKHLDTGSDKVKKICDAIRHETIEPAKQQARVIIEQAVDQAAIIIQEARAQADAILDNVRKSHEKEKHIFEASMVHAAKLFKEKFCVDLENHFLSPALDKVSSNLFHHADLCAKVVSALVAGFKNKTFNGDLVAMLSAELDKKDFVNHLASDIKNQISKVENGDFSQGIILKLEGDNLRIDFNKEGLTKALMDSLRSDFRKYFFQGS